MYNILTSSNIGNKSDICSRKSWTQVFESVIFLQFLASTWGSQKSFDDFEIDLWKATVAKVQLKYGLVLAQILSNTRIRAPNLPKFLLSTLQSIEAMSGVFPATIWAMQASTDCRTGRRPSSLALARTSELEESETETVFESHLQKRRSWRTRRTVSLSCRSLLSRVRRNDWSLTSITHSLKFRVFSFDIITLNTDFKQNHFQL